MELSYFAIIIGAIFVNNVVLAKMAPMMIAK